MWITQEEIYELYRVSRGTLRNWEQKGYITKIAKLPGSGHRRYLKDEIEQVLGIKEVPANVQG